MPGKEQWQTKLPLALVDSGCGRASPQEEQGVSVLRSQLPAVLSCPPLTAVVAAMGSDLQDLQKRNLRKNQIEQVFSLGFRV